MVQEQKTSRYDLKNRTLEFARAVRAFVGGLTRTIGTIEDGKQLIRSSGSIGANYIEADEALSKKDLDMRLKICRKEAKETIYWSELIDVVYDGGKQKEQQRLIQEATEFVKIFSTILKKRLS